MPWTQFKTGKDRNQDTKTNNDDRRLVKHTVCKDVTAFCFNGTPTTINVFAGYGDGLICQWEIQLNISKDNG